MTQTQAYLYLAFAIVAEVIGTAALKASVSFTRPIPSLVTVGCYALSFYLLTFSLRVLPAGIAYAIWPAVGIVLISLISWFVYGQRLDLPAIADWADHRRRGGHRSVLQSVGHHERLKRIHLLL